MQEGDVRGGMAAGGFVSAPLCPPKCPSRSIPRSKLSPNATVALVGTRDLKIPGCHLRKAAGARRGARCFRRVIFVRKASAVPAAMGRELGNRGPLGTGTSPRVSRLRGGGCSPHTHPQPLPMGMPALQTQTGPNPASSPNGTLVPIVSGGEVPGTPLGQYCGDHHLPHQRGPSPTTPLPFLPWLHHWVTLASPHPPSALGTLFLPSPRKMTHPDDPP